MKKAIITLTIFVVGIFSVFSDDGSAFWTAIERNDLETAVQIAEEMKAANEIYSMYLGVTHSLLGDLLKFQICKFDYYKNPFNDDDFTKIAEEVSEVYESSYVYSFLGIMLWENNLKNFAKRYLRESVEMNPDNPYGNNYFSMIFYDRKNEEYLKYAAKALTIKNDYSEAYNNAAVANQYLGRDDEAVRLLKKCIEVCEKPHVNTYHNLLNLLGDDGIAIKYRRGEYTIEGNSAISEEGIGTIHELLLNSEYKYEQMLGVLIDRADYNETRRLVELAVDSGLKIETNYYLAIINYLNNYNEKFVEYSTKCLDGEYIDYRQLYELGNIFYEMNFLDKAALAYEKALSVLPEYDTLYGMRINANLGVVHLQQGNNEAGLKYLESGLKYNQYDEIALSNIGYLYKQLGDEKQSDYYLQKAIDYSSDENFINRTKSLMDS